VVLTIILNVCASSIDKNIDGFPAYLYPCYDIDNIIVNSGNTGIDYVVVVVVVVVATQTPTSLHYNTILLKS